MNVDESDWEEFKRSLRRNLRHLKRRLPRGLLYRAEKTARFIVVEFFLALFVFILFYLWEAGLIAKLDWNTITSIVIADIPVGIVLYLILERGSARNRHLLDVVELHAARAKLSHLEIHRSDPWDIAEAEDEHYYIVNSTTQKAFWVDEPTHDLVKAGLIRVAKRHKDFAELVRYLDANRIEHPTDHPRGNDLGLGGD